MPQYAQFTPMTAAQQAQYLGSTATAPTAVSPPQSNALVPAARGSMAAVAGKMTAPYNQSPYTPGKTFIPLGGGPPRSAPTDQQVNTAQHELITLKQMSPLMQELAKEQPFFAKSGEMAKIRELKGLGFLHHNLPGNTNLSGDIQSWLHLNPQDLTNYGIYQNNLNTLAQQYANAHGWQPNEVNVAQALKSVSPKTGESADYVSRLQNISDYLNTVGNVNRNILSGGLKTRLKQSSNINGVPANTPPPVAPSPAPSVISIPKAQSDLINSIGLNEQQRMNLVQGKQVQDQSGNTWIYVNGQLGKKPAGK